MDSESLVSEIPYITPKNFHGEEWKLIPKLPHCYEISNLGRIRYLIGLRKAIHPTYNRANNLYVNLNISATEKQEFKVVDLVLITFCPNYFVGCKIIFRDGNRYNVARYNIKWKAPKMYHSNQAEDIKKWKCGRKAGSANGRYSETTSEKITAHDVFRVLEIMNFKCFYCGDLLDANSWQLDHYTPVSMGGGNVFKNLACACRSCNIMKSDMDGNQFVNKINKLFNSKKLILDTNQ